MAWLVDALRENPALALFAVLAIGFALGQVRVGTFQPGPVLGCLIAVSLSVNWASRSLAG
jgi:putative transport protein